MVLAPWGSGKAAPCLGPRSPVCLERWASHLPEQEVPTAEGAEGVRPQAPGKGYGVSATCPRSA